jgi:Xaa-Pro aminopeptidase
VSPKSIPNPYRKRIDRLLEALERSGFSGILISQPENRRYLSGFRPTDPQINESSGFLILGTDVAILGTDARYEEEARTQAKGFYSFIYRKGLEGSWGEIEPFLKKIDKIAFESQAISYQTYQRFKNLFQAARKSYSFKPSNLLAEYLRMQKDRQELKAIQHSLEITEKVLEEIFKSLRPGISEKNLAWKIKDYIFKFGGEGPSFEPIVASGPNAALPHAEPTERLIQKGEPILFDFGSKWQGYCSDISRTFLLGRPSDRFREVYALVRKAQLSAEKGIRAGMDSVAADFLARSVIEKGGYGPSFKHSLGHGLGLAVHEMPSLSPMKPMVLKPGMVVTIEPGIYLPGWGGVRLENMVAIGEKGGRLLNRDQTFYHF